MSSKTSFFARYRLFWQKFRFLLMRDGYARARFLKEKEILRGMGERVYFYSRIFPADPKLLLLHNNISIATNVRFINHDRIDIMLNGMWQNEEFREKYKMRDDMRFKKQYGCIEIMDNVFIGADSIILPGVRIGPNAIVAAGSVVARDVLPGEIVGGSPARTIGSFDKLVRRRSRHPKGRQDEDRLWEQFEYRHSPEYEEEKKRRREAREKRRARKAAKAARAVLNEAEKNTQPETAVTPADSTKG